MAVAAAAGAGAGLSALPPAKLARYAASCSHVATSRLNGSPASSAWRAARSASLAARSASHCAFLAFLSSARHALNSFSDAHHASMAALCSERRTLILL